jgi:hypothetical protein
MLRFFHNSKEHSLDIRRGKTFKMFTLNIHSALRIREQAQCYTEKQIKDEHYVIVE